LRRSSGPWCGCQVSGVFGLRHACLERVARRFNSSRGMVVQEQGSRLGERTTHAAGRPCREKVEPRACSALRQQCLSVSALLEGERRRREHGLRGE
jgi:hypothetical protein